MCRSLGVTACLAVFFAGSGQAQSAAALRFNGDFRLRYEYTTRGNGAPNIDKEVVRLRAGITYPLRDYLTVRARIATGSPGDPNSTDITLGQFVDDLAFSVDMASVELNRPRWGLMGGKFINPLLSTELVWDGDVNPQGLAGRVTAGKMGKVTGTLTGLYFVVDQQANDTGSDMAGGQLALKAKAGARWQVTAAASYYDYRIRSLALADAGDIRGNRLAPGGARYLSDFDLLNALVTVDYTGFGERFPLRVVGDYVHNAGKRAKDLNTGWAADAYVGRVTRPGEARWRYGYAVAETDAILAAFAHDNTTLGTNSETHTLAVDAVPMAGMLLTGTWYVYRPHQVAAGVRRQYQTRLRLNAMVTF
ncbi:MAG TPA: putative porin [Gemmatimonadales bacterium]|nr:putative porin [Gemmatimonadales bacterium]